MHWLQTVPVVDAIIALTVLEALALWAYHRATARGLHSAALLPNLAAGLCLLLALRAALAGAAWPWMPLALAAAGLAHLADLRARWLRKG